MMVLTGDAEAAKKHDAMLETAITSSLQHPHIVQAMAYNIEKLSEHDSVFVDIRNLTPGNYDVYKLYLVQEYCDQGTLTEFLR